MIFRYILDGNYITEPVGWDKFSTDIKRDNTTNGINLIQNFDLEFGVTQYYYFKNRLDANGWCDYSIIDIDYSRDNGNTWQNFHKGIIYASDLTFDEKRKEVKARVQDNSYYAFIKNNINIGAFLYSDQSKNGVTIVPPTLEQGIFFEPSTGYNLPNANQNGWEYKVYKVFDVFRYLIDFMTDGMIGFKSNTFDIGGAFEGYMITTGYVLRYSWGNVVDNPAGVSQQQFKDSWRQVSFKSFFDEMNKRLNLRWWIEDVGGVQTFRIEQASDSTSSNKIGISNSLIDELSTSVDLDTLYSHLSMGNGANDNASFLQFNENYKIIGFATEDIVLTGQCNLDNTLDLVTSYIHDTNVIENILLNGWASSFDNTYDNSIFIFNYDTGNPFTAIKTNWISTPTPYFYNEQLNNFNIIQRWILGGVSTIGTTNAVTAYRPPNTLPRLNLPLNSPVRFPENTPPNGSDPSGYFGNGTSTPISQANSRFTALTADIYFHSIAIQQIYITQNLTSGIMGTLWVYDSFGSPIASYGLDLNTMNYSINSTISFNFVIPSFHMNVGDYCELEIIQDGYASNGGIVLDGTGWIKWRITSNANINGSTIQINDNSRTINIKSEFKMPLVFDDYLEIKSNLPSLIPFKRAEDLSNRYGWIKSMRYDHKTQIANFVLLSSKNIYQ